MTISTGSRISTCGTSDGTPVNRFFAGRPTRAKVQLFLAVLYQLFLGCWASWIPIRCVCNSFRLYTGETITPNPWGHRTRLSLFRALEDQGVCEVRIRRGLAAEMRLTALTMYVVYYGPRGPGTSLRTATGASVPMWQDLNALEPQIRQYVDEFCGC